VVTTATAAADVWEVLERVPDPEIPVLSVVDLGIPRDVTVSEDGRQVRVTITPTYSGCPAMAAIEADVRRALAEHFEQVAVDTALSPPWTTDWISESGRRKLAAYGIAPPPDRRLLPVVGTGRPATCPLCGAADTERVSEFGSTPCKSLYRCRECREPFDYFKCH
jgi:ring-1,2-phenylacetyl-CoA epoxidase subunit PaaD